VRLIAGWCAGCVVLSCIHGCAFIKPTTELQGPGWRFTDTKDNDIDLVCSYDPDTHAFKIEKLVISNKSSPVIEANVQQMLAFVEQQKAANEGIKAAFAGIAETVGSLVPIVQEMRQALAEFRGQAAVGAGGVSLNVGPPAPVSP